MYKAFWCHILVMSKFTRVEKLASLELYVFSYTCISIISFKVVWCEEHFLVFENAEGK